MYGGGMYGGLGGMGSMYGGGMGSMYGGGMGSMYGGGMGSMYGGGMGSMYGGGLGSGMYGGGMGGGMYGNNTNSFMSQNNGLGSNGLGGMLNSNDPNGQQQQLGGQNGSLLPSQTDAPGSPINQVANTLPPLNETNEERGRRIRAERRKNRQLIHQQREQRRQMQLQAKMEVAGHLTNVLVQTLRSTMELFAVCFGTYYSVKAVRGFANTQQQRMQYQRGPNGQMIPMTVAPMTSQGTANSNTGGAAEGGGKGRWKTWLLFGIILIIAEVLYSRVSRSFQPKQQSQRRRLRARRPVEDEFGNVYTQDEDFASTSNSEEEEEDSLLDSDAGFESDADATFAQEYASSHPTAVPAGAEASRGSRTRRVFQAVYDYEGASENGYLSFKAGDEFIVEDYVDGAWCEAIPVDGSHNHAATGGRGWVPSNFLRPLERTTKL